MTDLKPWPILAGTLVDTLGSVALGVVYVLLMFGVQIASGLPPAEEALSTADLVVIEILGLLLTALGGFVAGYMARASEVRHGLAVGAGALLVWLLLELITPAEALAAWYDVISLVAVVPAAAFGGYLARRVNVSLRRTIGAATIG